MVTLVFFLLYLHCAFGFSIHGETDTYIIMMKAEGYRRLSTISTLKVNEAKTQNYFHALISGHHDQLIHEITNRESSVVKIHSYTSAISGFSVRLKAEEAARFKGHPDVYAVTRDSFVQTTTTRSYSFLGLDRKRAGAWIRTVGTDVIIGVVDTGIWPEDPSFNDDGYGPVPSKFIGICQTGDNFTSASCNRKLIGARYFGAGYAKSIGVEDLRLIPDACNEYVSPRDAQGHGSHTSSIAAGAVTPNASIAGAVLGTAKGVAHGARIAHYKALWCNSANGSPSSGGANSDIIAAIDAAVGDGVDVISGSFGGFPAYTDLISFDALAFVTYYATLSGVACVMAAGNSGPYDYTVSNSAPWIYTIGAGTIDRRFQSSAVLGSGDVYLGLAVSNSGTPSVTQKTFFELVDAENVGFQPGDKLNASLCLEDSLDPVKVEGKIVLCLQGVSGRVEKGIVVTDAGGVGMIEYNQPEDGDSLAADIHFLPAVAIGHKAGLAVKKYIASTKNPKAYITPTEIKVGSSIVAPELAGFSSIGPNGASLNILKPDIIAPGVGIFAAWSQSPKSNGGATTSPLPDGTLSAWNIISGTSMACPHAAGVVALVKSYHPEWLPSMIFSAISTTARSRNNNGGRIQSAGINANPFSIGSGHINPNKALDPGLVLRIGSVDYDTFICSFDSGIYTYPTNIDFFNCSEATRAIDLNIPSITFYNVSKTISTKRTLTNVGPAGTYYAYVKQPRGSSLSVRPSKLTFEVGEILEFSVELKPLRSSDMVNNHFTSSPSSPYTIQDKISWVFGYIVWYDNKGHRVNLPLAVNVI